MVTCTPLLLTALFGVIYTQRAIYPTVLSACRIWPQQINMHLQIQLAVWKLPEEYLIANYTVSPFYQIAKNQ